MFKLWTKNTQSQFGEVCRFSCWENKHIGVDSFPMIKTNLLYNDVYWLHFCNYQSLKKCIKIYSVVSSKDFKIMSTTSANQNVNFVIWIFFKQFAFITKNSNFWSASTEQNKTIKLINRIPIIKNGNFWFNSIISTSK